MEMHIAEFCQERKISCVNCHITVAAKDMRAHAGICPDALVACGMIKCSEKVKRANIEEHRKHCSLQKMNCPLCDGQIVRNEWLQHVAVCPQVIVKCPNDDCKFSAIRKDISEHAHMCCRNPVKCDVCNTIVPVVDFHDHTAYRCRHPKFDDCKVGTLMCVIDENDFWLLARVVEKKDDSIKVHFAFWDNRFDMIVQKNMYDAKTRAITPIDLAMSLYVARVDKRSMKMDGRAFNVSVPKFINGVCTWAFVDENGDAVRIAVDAALLQHYDF
jgi:hypothetical protein